MTEHRAARHQGVARELSVVVIFHDMVCQANRTLFSLSAAYQADVSGAEYEVIAVDNGSAQPLDRQSIEDFGPNFRYRFFETESPSPADAVNAGVQMASGELIAIIVDGARMATPGLVGTSLKAARLFDHPFVVALSWHLGPDIQNRSMLKGYDQAEEERLLASIDWRNNGYGLFDISTLAPSSSQGFIGGVPPECSWFVMPRRTFFGMGGFEPRFQSPGGGLVNHEFRNRALNVSGIVPIVLLGEGVFHQYHGGVSTNVDLKVHPMSMFEAEYRVIVGEDFKPAESPPPHFFGKLSEKIGRFIGQ